MKFNFSTISNQRGSAAYFLIFIFSIICLVGTNIYYIYNESQEIIEQFNDAEEWLLTQKNYIKSIPVQKADITDIRVDYYAANSSNTYPKAHYVGIDAENVLPIVVSFSVNNKNIVIGDKLVVQSVDKDLKSYIEFRYLSEDKIYKLQSKLSDSKTQDLNLPKGYYDVVVHTNINS